MTINWPITPNVGDTIEGPRGEVWKWDGVKWVSVVGAGGGNGGGGPQMGVTDGSDAAPGELGEYLIDYFFSDTVGPYQNMPTFIAALELPAGDWDVTANSQFFITGPVLYVRLYLDYDGGEYGDLLYRWASSQSIPVWSFSTGPIRVSNASARPAQIFANIASSDSTSTATAQGTITARRMR